jgi:glucokinase
LGGGISGIASDNGAGETVYSLGVSEASLLTGKGFGLPVASLVSEATGCSAVRSSGGTKSVAPPGLMGVPGIIG